MARKNSSPQQEDMQDVKEIFSDGESADDLPEGNDAAELADTEGSSTEPEEELADGSESAAVEEQQGEQQRAEEPRFKLWDGSEITLSQLAADPKLAERIVQTANQAPHLQRKYVELLEEIRQRVEDREAQRGAVEKQEERPKTREELIQSYVQQTDALAEELVRNGLLSEETVQLAPDLVRVVLRILDGVTKLSSENELLRSVIHEQLLPSYSQAQQIGQMMVLDWASKQLESKLSNLVSSNQALQNIVDQSSISQIARMLTQQFGPEILEVDERHLIGALLAQQPDVIVDALSRQAAAKADRVATQKARAVGERTSPKAGGTVRNADILDVFSGG